MSTSEEIENMHEDKFKQYDVLNLLTIPTTRNVASKLNRQVANECHNSGTHVDGFHVISLAGCM